MYFGVDGRPICEGCPECIGDRLDEIKKTRWNDRHEPERV